MDDANELIGSEVVPTLATELIVGTETIVGAAGVVVSEAAGGETTTGLEAAAEAGGA